MTSQQQRPALGVPLDELVGLLDLEEVGTDHYRGGHTAMSAQLDHVFGGLVAAQALVAAGRTVAADRAPHSLHAYFLRPGDHRVPMELHVARNRDGGSLSHRTISVEQDGEVIAALSGSFARPLEGPEHQLEAPATVGPDELRPDHEVAAALDDVHPAAKVIDGFELRTAPRGAADGTHRMWLRAAGTVGADPLLNAALLVYASDLRVLQPILRPHHINQLGSARRVMPATIDHTVWFHAPARVEAWHLMVSDSPWAADGRGLARGSVFDADGRLVASVAQEAMVRYRR